MLRRLAVGVNGDVHCPQFATINLQRSAADGSAPMPAACQELHGEASQAIRKAAPLLAAHEAWLYGDGKVKVR